MTDDNDNDSKRIASALDEVLRWGNYFAVIKLMRDFALEAKITKVADAYLGLRALSPRLASKVQQFVPGIIANNVLYKDPAIQLKLPHWIITKDGYDWGDGLREAIDNPVLFELSVKAGKERALAYEKPAPVRATPVTFSFQVRQLEQDGSITWEAIEDGTGHTFEIGTSRENGAYPEIEEHLSLFHGVYVELAHKEDQADSLDRLTWTFRRGPITVVVRDIVRTVVATRSMP